tara:strand:+ start:165 stop:398 length:234 start_codon:yes stop_codon:yes gene_type:complete
MKNLVLAIFLFVGLSACNLPLVGNLTSTGITGASTGKYHQSLAKSGFDMLVHHNTGHTPTELLLKKLQNKKKPAPHS